MVLAIDIGNTHILLGCFEERKVLFTELLTTDKTATELEYASFIKSSTGYNLFTLPYLLLSLYIIGL